MPKYLYNWRSIYKIQNKFMTTLKIDDKEALVMYPNASPFEKMILEQSFPAGFFVPKSNLSIIERTPTVEAALAIAGKTVEGLTRPDDAPYETACRIMENVIAVLNEGVSVDHSNSSQDKYEPRFYHKSGLGLRCHGYDRWRTDTRCGPRLCYLSYDKMMHGLKILEDYYITYFNSKLQ